MLTKNRIGNGLAVAGAVLGMVLVITGAGQKHGGDDDAPAAPPTTSQVAPAVPGQAGAPAQSQAPAPGQSQPAAPAAPTKDDDGDDDGN